MATLKELRQERIKKLKKLKKLGINPFPAHAKKDVSNAVVTDGFEQHENKTLSLTGRIMSWRQHGQIIFADLQDETGKIQLYIKEETLEKTNKKNQTLGFEDLNLFDIGDFVEASGKITKTKTGEISIEPTTLKLLAKSIRPLPEKREGLKDPEIIFRRRYLDLTMNPEVRELFKRKARFWKSSRDYLYKEGFIEVETPILEHHTGGADAKPFITHHEALDQDFYLRISTELYQKRLIGGNYEKVFTLGPNFRNEGLSDEHLQEFMQLEWYWAYADYKDNMELVKNLFRNVAKEVYGNTKFKKGEHEFDLNDEWDEIDYSEIIKKEFDIDVFKSSDEEILKVLKKHKVKLPGAKNRNRLIDNLWKLLRKNITGPAFLINHPKFISPLAKSMPENEQLTERYQIIIAGSELGNGYSELNDPFDQLERFLEQQDARDAGDPEAQMLDIDYVEMLEYGMPPTSGHGHSERFFWFLEDITAREGVFFPQMRKKLDEVTKEIYNMNDSKEKAKKTIEKDFELPQKNADFDEKTANELLEKHVEDDYQKLHARMVANAMRAYATKEGEDETLWFMTGLLHDLDYFNFPDDHPNAEISWYTQWGFPEEFIHAVAAHAHMRSGVEPESKMASALAAIDELAGFLYAYSLMRPEGFTGMKAKSVKKKFKDKAFARKIDRDDISYGVEKLGADFSELITFLIEVYRGMDGLKSA